MTSEIITIIHTAIAILGVVVLITRFRLNPAVALVIGSLYLGLATGNSPTDTIGTITGGFGEIMAEVGLLITFGVLLGSMLSEMNAIQRLVSHLLRIFGPKGLPYAMGLTIGTVLQSIFLDVLLVISAPLARKMAPLIGKHGTPRIATALAIGLECGIVFMVPGVAALALAGVLGVPLGQMLLFGLIVIVPTIVISIFIMTLLFRIGFWKEKLDETQPVEGEDAADDSIDGSPEPVGPLKTENIPVGDRLSKVGGVPRGVAVAERTTTSEPKLILLFSPLLLCLALIATGAILQIAGIEIDALVLITDPVFALLIAVLGTSVIGRLTVGVKAVEKSVVAGFRESGQILILTGVGGALAATVAATGLGDILGQAFGAHSFAPLLIVWAIAAVLHVAVGSVTISAITAAGILAPIASVIGLDPILIALAAGAGSLFAVHVTSNTFWLLQSLLGQTTRGTLKTCTVGVSVASVVALLVTLVLSIFI
ncbi:MULTISPECIES: GntP family permease [unclassified Pseudoclavibacter]|uniref:GntP family permease n=1 Tax=unclassified Pseudoclavibacter TaxID=2615177 RepID=UPI001BADB25F|nr:SLC13 family permease [Pseudoclavibacter sp. Marseille-Q4354]MBS3179288.1 gluconate permease [Pseudoclavibacter sp. Marseille-Q4354]